MLVCKNRECILMGELMKNLVIFEGGYDRGVFVVVDNVGKIEFIVFDDKVD